MVRVRILEEAASEAQASDANDQTRMQALMQREEENSDRMRRTIKEKLHFYAREKMDTVREGAIVLVAEQDPDESGGEREVVYLLLEGCAGISVTFDKWPVIPVSPRAPRIQGLIGKKRGDKATFRNVGADDVVRMEILAII